MGQQQGDIHADHRQRMHARFAEQGFDGFAEHEALEYLLFFCIPRKDVNPLAHRLIGHFGSFAKVLEASEPELLQVEGIGPATARFLVMVMQAGRFYQRSRVGLPKTFRDLEEIAACLTPCFHGASVEYIYALFLDDRNCPLKLKCMAEGSINESALSKRAVAQMAVRLGATQVVLAHNHPSGLALPSGADLAFTGQLGQMLHTLGIRLLDHIIVDAEGDYLSMQQTNRMPELPGETAL